MVQVSRVSPARVALEALASSCEHRASRSVGAARTLRAILAGAFAELEAELASEQGRVEQARQWIVNCVDPVAVGVEKKAEMLAALDPRHAR